MQAEPDDDDHPASPKLLDVVEAVIEHHRQAGDFHERAVLAANVDPAEFDRATDAFVDYVREFRHVLRSATLDLGFGIRLVVDKQDLRAHLCIDEWHGPRVERIHDLDAPGDGQ